MRKHIPGLKTSSFLFLSLFLLAACGGGGGTAPTGGGNNNEEEVVIAYTLSMLNSSSELTTSISDSAPATLLVEVAEGLDFDGEIASFSTDLGEVSPSTALVSGGQASVVLSTNSESPGAGTVTVVIDAVQADLNFEIVEDVIVPGPVDPTLTGMTVQLLQDASDTNSDITSISESNPGVIYVELLGDAEVIAAEIVSFTSTIGELEKPSDLSDTSGIAESAITVGATTPQAGTITVSAGDLEPVSINFEIVSEGIVSTDGFSIQAGLYDSGVDLDDLAGSTQITSVSTVGSGFFVVTVTNVLSGDPVEGVIVTVTTTDGELVQSNILTNSNGIAAAEITSGEAVAGSAATLSATIDDVSASLNFAFGSVDLQLGRDANDFVDPDDVEFVDGEVDISLVGELSSNGTTVLTVIVVSSDDTTSGFDTPLTVNFSSNCSAAGTSVIDTGITTVNGIAEATYTAQGCEGEDTITATIEELSGVTAVGTLTVESPVANSIQFISADPTNISLSGTGDDQSTLTFRVLDGSGAPFSGETVTMMLSTTVGGITLTGDGDDDGTITADSNADGDVTAFVNAGVIPTSVRVEASIVVGSDTISTVSDSLVISTGLPDQNSFEVVASVLNPGGNGFSGIESELTVFASDAFNNPVPDGTTINFITEYGTVDATCITAEGVCNATWTSSEPRSPDNTANTGAVQTIFNTTCDLDGDGAPDQSFSGVPCLNPLSYEDDTDIDFDGDTDDYIVRNVKGGRTTILAYAIGEESFVDANGSGLYDWIDTDADGIYDASESLEQFVDLPEAYIDHNDDGVFGNPLTGCDAYDGDGDTDPATNITTPTECAGARTGGQEEEFVDFIDNNIYDVGNGIYNGTLCHPDVEAASPPGCTTDLVNVRDETRILMAGETAYLAVYSTAQAEAFTGGFSVYAGDAAAGGEDIDHSGGDTIQVVVSDLYNGYLPNETTIDIETDNCTITGLSSYTIGNTSSDGVFSFFLGLRQDESGEVDTGTVTITATVPASAGGSAASTLSFTCNDEPVT